MFWGKSFIWDSVPSETYNLGIVNFDTGKINSPAGSDIEMFTKSVYRKPKVYLYGVSQRPVLQFSLTIGSPDYVDANMRSLIEKYLFGHTSYKKLQILETDLQDVYFNCLITKGVSSYIGNMNIGFECDVICDSPWAYEFPKTLYFDYPENVVTDTNYTFFNMSANNDYTYPTIEFKINNVGVGNPVRITNYSDNDRIYGFTGLAKGELITTDCERQIFTTSRDIYRLNTFNKNWLRFVPGANLLNIYGGLSYLEIVTQNVRKVGG